MVTQRESNQTHIPVMVTEVLTYLNVRSNGIYLDGTIGSGGHAKQILSGLTGAGRLIGIDWDEEALEICRQNIRTSSSPVSLHHTSYAVFPEILRQSGIQSVSGMLLDLGLSSLQLYSTKRGFSFNTDGLLDMRFNSSNPMTAAELIRNSSVEQLTKLIWNYGEDRSARKIALSIKRTGTLKTVQDLKQAIRRCTPPNHRGRTYARVFQALRIAVNEELDQLSAFLDRFIDYLTIGGRIVVLSYHSLEDRLVKRQFRYLQSEGKLSVLTKKPVRPADAEIQKNRRSKSAKLRAAERVA